MKASQDIFYLDDDPAPLLDNIVDQNCKARFWSADPLDMSSIRKSYLFKSSLWVFDFFSDEAQRIHPTLDGSNGLSLFQQFRRIVGDSRPPTVLISNDLRAALGKDIDSHYRHVLAEQVGVEWIASKTSTTVIEELISIADAYLAIRKTKKPSASASRDSSLSLAKTILKAPPRASWLRSAARDIADSRPPNIDGPGEHRARTIVSWLLRSLLPYPGPLLRDRHIACALGITLESFRTAMRAKNRLRTAIHGSLYSGPLQNFDGARWWRSGVDGFILDLPRTKDEREAKLTKLAAPFALQFLTIEDPVVVSDADLLETDTVAAASECVRASDSHFPPFSPTCWVKIEDAREDRNLAQKIVPEDARFFAKIS